MEKAELVLKAEPKNEQALLVKATVFLIRKEADASRALLEEKINEGVNGPDMFLVLSASYQEKGDAAGTERVLRKGLEANPKSVGLNLALANLYVRDKRLEDAIDALQRVLALDPDRPVHKLNLASLYWETGKEEKARELLGQVVSADKKNENGPLQVSAFYIAKKRYQDAESVLSAAAQKNPNSYKLRLLAADIYANTGRVDQAVKILKEYPGIDRKASSPDVIEVKNALARIDVGRGEIEEAGKYVDEVLKESPKSIDAHFTKGNIFLAKREGANAVAEFRMVVNERPGALATAYVKMAEGHMLANEPDLALDVLQTGLKQDPKSREVLAAISRLYMLRKDYGRAEEPLKKALEANPNDGELMADLGDVFFARKDIGHAEAEYGEIEEEAAQYYPGICEARRPLRVPGKARPGNCGVRAGPEN